MNPHLRVVRQFNQLGYMASFAAVAKTLRMRPETLYLRYPSREALGEAWLTYELPGDASDQQELRDTFGAIVELLLGNLESQRDFGRAWIAAIKPMGAMHLPQLRNIHEALHCYFLTWLLPNGKRLSLPPKVRPEDVAGEIADVMCAMVLLLLLQWESDRSPSYLDTRRSTDAFGYLLDGLLIRRDDFGQAGLLLHLHTLFARQHGRFLRPLLDIVAKPERAGRLFDPAAIFESLRDLRMPPSPSASLDP